jgi:E3 ubiquitin-protein ligase MARCH6
MEGEFDQRPLRAAAPFPDVMAFSSNVKGKGIEDPDTCRICRGEGSAEEPLFYPCKCSGSIKFVHQSCLMEWLGHSQKKYCELCKTPFRFTKIYDPNMPSELPAPVFVKELAVLGLRSLLTWLRFVLVAFVWLGWLPWSMRAIWRALFWLADGRWPTSHPSNFNQTRMQAIANGTTFITQSLAVGNSAASTSDPAATSEPTNVLSPMTSILNFSTGEPVVFAIAKRLFLGLFAVSSRVSDESSPHQTNATLSRSPRGPSWLSNVTFLNSLTSSPTVNNIVIDTLEGQLITLLVVISFILVFLIREWVVQQQPVVNVGEEERDAVVQLIDRNQVDDEAQEDVADALDIQPEIAEEERPGDDYDKSGSDMGEHTPSDDDWAFESREPSPEFTAVDSRPILPMRSSSSRPTLPSRNALDDASSIQRTIEETATGSANQTWPGIDTFKELWSRGEGNPDQILQIIRDEGREEDLGWIVNAMTKLQGSNNEQSTVIPSFSAGGHLREIFDDEASVSISRPGAGPSETQAPGSLLEQSNAARVETGKLDVPSEHRSGEVGQGNSEPTVENTESSTNPIGHPEPSSSAANEEGTPSPAINATESAQAEDQTLVDRVLDWFWGDLTAEPDIKAEDDDVHIIDDPPLEAALAPVPNRVNDAADDDAAAAANPWQEQVAGPANQDANDPDVVDEADDFEGILELIGMQGPIFGLLQNGVFSALLISFTIGVGIWLPYLWGKIALVFLTSPIQLFISVPLTMLSITADVAIDTLIGSVGYVFYWVILVLKTLLRAVYGLIPLLDLIPPGTLFTKTSLTLIHESSRRLNKVLTGFFDFHETDLPMFSVLAHQALRIHEARIAGLFKMIGAAITFILYDLPTKLISHEYRHDLVVDISQVSIADLTGYLKTGGESLIQQGLSLLGKSGWVREEIAVAIGSDYDLARWDTTDRTIAILIGYTFASLLGILYLKINSMFTGVNRGQRIDGVVAEILNQAGGVMKVILIIGIEMIVFPLYCGLLLDLALMPLFEHATLASRIEFTVSSPLTSLFIHWFVGTCYMFHFALFVSMCRKIMRTGVLCKYTLYLIRATHADRWQTLYAILMIPPSIRSAMSWSVT